MKEAQLKLLGQQQIRLLDALNKQTTIDTNFWSNLWKHLQEDEQLLISLMGNTPPLPKTPGNLELSWALYALNIGPLGETLRDKYKMPASKITFSDWISWYEVWTGAGVLMGDGSLVSDGYYAVMNILPDWSEVHLGWGEALVKYLEIELGTASIEPFKHTPAIIKPEQKSLKIALFGDWGTGPYPDGGLPNSPSQLVMAQMNKLNPDVMIHLGDIYYAGSIAEENANLLACWPDKAPYNLTMNSNHEMYSGALGIYHALSTPLFKCQQNTTYFAINYGDWVILGLDSAYNATDFYMQGVVNDQYQESFVKGLNLKDKKVILLTHHNPIDTTGEHTNSLWGQIVTLLGGTAPEVWYWGHVHNGIVYSKSAASGNTKARCLGHAGIPFGTASWLTGRPSVEYFTNTPLGDDTHPNNALRVKNGFAILEIQQQTGVLTETWYDQDGDVCWQSPSA